MAGLALIKANRTRKTPGSVSPFALWQAANQDAKGSVEGRRYLFRHAMIHAGYLNQPKKDPKDDAEPGRPYAVCPICDRRLERTDDAA